MLRERDEHQIIWKDRKHPGITALPFRRRRNHRVVSYCLQILNTAEGVLFDAVRAQIWYIDEKIASRLETAFAPISFIRRLEDENEVGKQRQAKPCVYNDTPHQESKCVIFLE